MSFKSVFYDRLYRFFNAGHARTISVKRNIFASLSIKSLSILVNFTLVPLTINFIAAKDYGIWLTISAIVSWFSFFDIGFGNGLRNKFAEAVSKKKYLLAKSYVSTTYFFLSLVIFIIWAIFIIFNKFISWSYILGVPSSENQTLSKVVFIVFSFFCVQFVLKLVSTILYASNKTGKASSFDLISQVILLSFLFVYTRFFGRGSLTILAYAFGGIQVLVLFVASFFFFGGDLQKFKPNIKFVNIRHVRSLMGIGFKFFIIQLSAIFIFESTNIIISHLYGPEKVAAYNIVFRYFNIVAMICSIIASPFWSYFTDAFVKQDFVWMRKVFKQLNMFWLILCFFAFFMLLISKYVFWFWIAGKVEIPYSLILIMFLNVLAVTRLNIFIALLNGIGKIQLQLLVNVVLSIIFIPSALLLSKFFFLNGILFTTFMVNSIYAILVPYQCKKILYHSANGIWNN